MSTSEPEFDRLARRHKDAVLRQMVRACGNRDDAEDVLAETLLAAYQARAKMRDPEAFGAWLAKVAHRACARLKHSEAARPVIAGLDLEPATAPPMDDTKQCIADAVRRLPEPLREAFVLRDVEGLSSEVAAERLGITVAALKTRLHRARASLRESLSSLWEAGR